MLSKRFTRIFHVPRCSNVSEINYKTLLFVYNSMLLMQSRK